MTGFSQPERRGLERMQLANPEMHPDADLLTAFAEHSLATQENEQVLAHLAVCANCREVIALAGSPLVEPVSEPARKRGLWEMPLFHWGAVAATTVVVVAAVSLGLHDRRSQSSSTMTAIHNEQLPPAVAQKEDKVVAEPTAKTQTVAGLNEASVPAAKVAENAPALPPKRSLHLQQEARYERPAPTATAKKQEVASSANNGLVHGNIASGGPVAHTNARDYLYNTNSNAVLKSKAADLSPAPAAAPAPPPSTLAENVPVRGVTEMVTVEADEAEKVEAKDQPASAAAQVAPQTVISDEKIQAYSIPMQKTARLSAAGPQWQIGSGGKLQRSAGSNVWQTVLPTQTFRTFAVIQNHVWAGGDKGLLYHSADNGQTWTPVSVKNGTTTLSGSISGLRFTDAQHGSLQTSTGETWTTGDGGQSWQKN